MWRYTVFVILVIFMLFSETDLSNVLLKRCYSCRSRGARGTCKDPFIYNTTQSEHGIQAVPCPSGWCGKIIEGLGAFRSDDYDMAVERMCIQRGPSDNEDRCTETMYNHRKVFMCFCQGDLCNSSNKNSLALMTLLPLFFYTLKINFL